MRNPGIILRLGRKFFELLHVSRADLYKSVRPNHIIDAKQGNDRIAEAILQSKPYMISRFGTPESLAILNYLDLLASESPSSVLRLISLFQGRWTTWQEKTKQLLYENVGFFPVTSEALRQFGKFYPTQIAQTDMLCYWGMVPGESFLINKYCPKADLFDPKALEPYFFSNPWSAKLAGKKVLVIHPFVDSISKQYKKRELLFKDPSILPEFELLTLRAVQSLAGTPTPFHSWFEALDSMKDQIDRLNFDVAIIGAGAYGLPLSAHVKACGKVAVHMGGSTQILFGIRGKRWDDMPAFSDFINEHWIRPAAHEMITHAKKIEDGCYW